MYFVDPSGRERQYSQYRIIEHETHLFIFVPFLINFTQITSFEKLYSCSNNRLLRVNSLSNATAPTLSISPLWLIWLKLSTFSINKSMSKFIDFTGNPFVFYISDCSRTHYYTQINKNIKIQYKIINKSCHLWRGPGHFEG